MATLAPNTSTSSPPLHRRRKSWARKVERICCQTLTLFPLTFVYGLTTWAVFIEVQVSFIQPISWLSYAKAALGVTLYALANASYTIAVFTPPGSPTDPRSAQGRGRKLNGAAYDGLPLYEEEEHRTQYSTDEGLASVTTKSTGKQRFCKKCKTVKPDRAHHCSSCKRCVLKMDHHCPWLATCVGLHNYKAFLLFLTYTSAFALLCFAVSIDWVWTNLMTQISIEEGWRLVNTIMLSVLGGIIGLVLSCFTAWHVWLTFCGQTTIESLEKTRYLNPLRKSMERQMQPGRNYLGQGNAEEQQSLTSQLTEIHANALPGVLRPEEGEVQHDIRANTLPNNVGSSPARQSLQRNFASMENQRQHELYEAYLDEQDSEKLPNAFDLGWRRNLMHVFGPVPWLWALPVCNTTGDGWKWEVSSKWLAQREEVARARAQREREDARWDAHNPSTHSAQAGPGTDLRWQPGQGFVAPPRAPRSQQPHQTLLQMQTLDHRKGSAADNGGDVYSSSSDDDGRRSTRLEQTANWNDVPEDFLSSHPPANSRRSRSEARTKDD